MSNLDFVLGEASWYYTGLTLLAVSLIFYLLLAFKDKPLFREGGWAAMLLACLCLIVSLIVRSFTAKYFALSNMYESMLTVCIGVQLAFLVMNRWFHLRTLGLPVSLLVLGALLWNMTLPTEIHPLQPALQSYWRSIHVPIILLSYALFTIAFLSSLVYLVKDLFGNRVGKTGGFDANSGSGIRGGGPLTPATAGADYTLMATHDHESMLDMEIALAQDKASVYDEITYRCVAFGFPLLTIGIILGGMWANEAWGNYWSWDPKESMSLVTLLGYGVYLHMRVNGEHSPRTLATVSVIGFALMLVTYFGVNLMGIGLHSYGKIG